MSNPIIHRYAIDLDHPSASLCKEAARILRRHIAQRCHAVMDAAAPQHTIALMIDASLPYEGFRIDRPSPDHTIIQGADKLGILYGVGRFLRDGVYQENGFISGQWAGQDHPIKPLRGIYLATHFHNYYHDAPAGKIIDYLEDITLWGFNTVQVWFDMHHYQGIDDPQAQQMIFHLKSILAGAKQIGLRTCMITLGNESYAQSPVELRADFKTGRANYKCELCPSKPGAVELMCHWFEEQLDAFADIQPDIIGFAPYDQGGCACQECAPWGSNGYLRICEAKARLVKNRWPQTKILLSTWLFDHHGDQGEWSGLAKHFEQGVDWCDYIQADSHETYPTFPLEQGVPGGLPLLNFPEISMWMMHPWGGFGANPLPARFEGLWQTVKDHVAGGFPYSEGIYEDINKTLCAQFYWNPDRSAESILREYIAYEYAHDVADEVLQAIQILEANHNHIWEMNWHLQRQARFPIHYKMDPRQAYTLLHHVDSRLTPQARSAWRWRILYLRALVDQELQPYDGYWANDICEAAFRELTDIYEAQQAEVKCAPPTSQAIHHLRTSEYAVTRH